MAGCVRREKNAAGLALSLWRSKLKTRPPQPPAASSVRYRHKQQTAPQETRVAHDADRAQNGGSKTSLGTIFLTSCVTSTQQPSRHPETIPSRKPLRWQLCAFAGSFPDYPTPVLRGAGDGPDAVGYAASAAHGGSPVTNIRDLYRRTGPTSRQDIGNLSISVWVRDSNKPAARSPPTQIRDSSSLHSTVLLLREAADRLIIPCPHCPPAAQSLARGALGKAGPQPFG